ncbi:Tetratricopeptide-like helical domain superfamily [Sesbania bispinosa]|nr:Tetratricopeptide-like helical domain superfamily [Sesbania bispinosa]
MSSLTVLPPPLHLLPLHLRLLLRLRLHLHPQPSSRHGSSRLRTRHLSLQHLPQSPPQKSLRNRSSTVSHYAGRRRDVVTFTIIIDALCKSKRFDEAARFWRALIDKGLSPDYKACAALVGLCGGGNVELAYELINGEE